MSHLRSLKIDVFPHITPPKYLAAVCKALNRTVKTEGPGSTPCLWDLDVRFRIMDKYEGLMQVLTLAMTTGIPDYVTDKKKSSDLCELANDEMAELVLKYPDRFAAAVATINLNDIDAALKETDRAIKDLKFRGVQIFTPTSDKPLDSPEFEPLYEKMASYNLPIWIHPTRGDDYPDYRTEKKTKYRISSTFGWPFETTAAMTRLVFSKLLEKYPNLKFITHHAGGMVPFYANRITQFQDTEEMLRRGNNKVGLSRSVIDYYKMFYADTAINGNTPALMLAHSFFGADHFLFGTDMPYDNANGDRDIRETIWGIEEMNISDEDKKKIFYGNVRNLLRLPV